MKTGNLRLVYDYRWVEEQIWQHLVQTLGREPEPQEFNFAWAEYQGGEKDISFYQVVGNVLKPR